MDIALQVSLSSKINELKIKAYDTTQSDLSQEDKDKKITKYREKISILNSAIEVIKTM